MTSRLFTSPFSIPQADSVRKLRHPKAAREQITRAFDRFPRWNRGFFWVLATCHYVLTSSSFRGAFNLEDERSKSVESGRKRKRRLRRIQDEEFEKKKNKKKKKKGGEEKGEEEEEEGGGGGGEGGDEG